MPLFRVTWQFGDRSASYLLEARLLEHAEKAARAYRLPGIRIMSVERRDDGEDGDAPRAGQTFAAAGSAVDGCGQGAPPTARR